VIHNIDLVKIVCDLYMRENPTTIEWVGDDDHPRMAEEID
jgi:hypothetical protein